MRIGEKKSGEAYHPGWTLSSDCSHRILRGLRHLRNRVFCASLYRFWECIATRRLLPSMNASTLLTPRQAAEKLGISYPALKHWILAGRIRTVKTPGGHHRIPLNALQEFLPTGTGQVVATKISGRNQLLGSITEVTIDGLLVKVVLAIGDQRITAIITA